MIRRPPRSTLFSLHDALPISASGHLEIYYDNGDQVNITWSGDSTSFDLSIEVVRSEEHTSELQSQSNLVCRLLLEKKKKNKNTYVHCTLSESTIRHQTPTPLR